MNVQEFMNAPRMRSALAALSVAVVALGGSAWSATRPADVQSGQAISQPALAALRVPSLRDPVSPDGVASADIFSADRKPAKNRFPMPDDPQWKPPDPGAIGRGSTRPVVQGTALSADPAKTFASVTWGGKPYEVQVGSTVGTFQVIGIGKNSVTFRSDKGDTSTVRRAQ